MRNYLAELKNLGYSLKSISHDTGISSASLSRIKSGIKPLRSTMPEYEVIRNAVRRASYQAAREAGLTPRRATAERRALSRIDIQPETVKELYRNTIKEVKHKKDTTRYQLRLLGRFYNWKTKETKTSQGYSQAYSNIDIKLMHGEAVAEAQSHLGGSNWKLQRVIEQEMMEYRIKADATGT